MDSRYVALQTWDPDLAFQRLSLSLCTVQREGVVRVDFYHWLRNNDPFKQGFALRVQLDSKDRIKYSVANSLGEAPIPLESMLANGTARYVLPDIGVAMHKSFRLDCPSLALKLRKMWSVAMGSSVGVSWAFCNAPCEVDNETVIICPLCDMSMHSSCGRLVADKFTFGSLPQACVPNSLPSWWHVRLCPLCMKLSQ